MLKWLILVFALTLAGCTKKKLEYGLELKDTIRLNIITEPPTMDWTKMHDSSSHIISINLMEGLTGIDYTNPELPVKPQLATEWSTLDGRVWTFALRKGVKWSDGVELTAQHVLDGIERLLNAKTASPYSYLLFPLKNGEAYFKGTVKDFSQVGVKVNAKGQIVFELVKPISYFPYIIGHQATYPVRKDIIAKYGEDKWADAGRMVTLGPYNLKVWDHDKNIVLERNEDYYGEKAKTKNVLAYMIADYSTAVNLYHANVIDFQEQLPFTEVKAMKGVPGFKQKLTVGLIYYGFNTTKPPFNNKKVRQAFVLGVDRKQLTDVLAAGQAPLASMVPPGSFGYDPNVGLKFDLKRANQLLDEAGFKDRSQVPHVVIGYNTDENNQRIAENIQAQIKKNLGIEAEIVHEEWKSYLAHLTADAPSIFRLGWIADFPDPDTFLGIFLSNSENNHTKFKSKEFDALVEQGASEMNKEKRRAIYLKAQKLLCEDEVPAMPLYVQAYNQLISPRLKDFPFNALERLDVRDTSIP
jgi:oligopeptide transport system substrate-binding protein